ncbi:hypothetical protein HJG60_008122 [Phyllostomus discolor]|uniref:Uncharacterized protein n=1 Tax=Phyllostomus discolor TaxID=89673 RepID=A0A834DP64_9CHIR|nr:hypothetical protein HJG60_008122 [Phyllostomus discolor]
MEGLALGKLGIQTRAKGSGPSRCARSMRQAPANSYSSFESRRERPLCSDGFPSASLLLLPGRSAPRRPRPRHCVRPLSVMRRITARPGRLPRERRQAGISGAGPAPGPGHFPPGPAAVGNVTRPTGLWDCFCEGWL